MTVIMMIMIKIANIMSVFPEEYVNYSYSNNDGMIAILMTIIKVFVMNIILAMIISITTIVMMTDLKKHNNDYNKKITKTIKILLTIHITSKFQQHS